MRVTLVISSLGGGGAERVMTAMANHWASQGREVTLITYSPSEDFYKLSTAVTRVRLNLLAPTRSLLHAGLKFVWRWWSLRRAIQASKPDVVLSFMDKTNVLTLLACAGLRLRVAVAERTNPVHYTIPRTWSRLRDVLYRHACAVVVQTESLRTWANLRCDPARVHVIPNALDEARLSAMTEAVKASTDSCWDGRIMAMGRMTPEKGHDLLLAACAQVLPEFPRWRLELIGDGPLRTALQAQQSEISNQVVFHGQLVEPFGTLKAADIFVLPSRVEGFPNVLLEAMALGRPCVSFNCPSGPSELIDHEVNGLLVPAQDVAELATAIRRLILQPQVRAQLGAQARVSTTRFTEGAVMQQWDKVLAL